MDREKGILVARSGVRIPGATQGFWISAEAKRRFAR
jgi:hypothetical protein